MLHGRAGEVATIDDLLAGARAGRSAALVVRGGAGLGKSALLDHAALLAGDMRVVRATGIQSEAELAFAALHLLLRPGLGRLDELPAPQAAALRGALGLAVTDGDDRFLIGLAALSLLAELADGAALLCIVDDAHWLDGASADALLFAARRLDAEGIVLLFAARDTGFAAQGLPELRLGPLDRAAARALLDEHSPDLPGSVADRVLAEADGNPLALLELPGTPAGTPTMAPLPLPGRLQETYYQQVTALPAATRRFLLVAAAEETGDLTAILLACVTLGGTADAIGAAEQAGLVTVANLTVTFRHPLIRAAVYQGAVFADRCAAHSALAIVLTGDQDADRRAWHLAGAATGPDEDIAAALEHTATRARQRRGYAAAAAALERAAMLTPQRATRALRLIAAAESAGDAARPIAAVTLADQAAVLTEDPLAQARIARVHARVDIERGAMRAAHQRLVAAAGPIATLDPTAATVMLVEAGRAASWLGDLELAREADAGLRSLAGHPALAPLVSGALAMPDLLAGNPDRALPQLTNLVATYRANPPHVASTTDRRNPPGAENSAPPPDRRNPPGDNSAPPTGRRNPPGVEDAGPVDRQSSRSARDARLFASSVALLVGDFDAARDIGLALARECRADGTIGLLPLIHTNVAFAEMQLNRFAEATATATEGLRLAADTGQSLRVVYLRGILAGLAAIEGDGARCRELSDLVRQDSAADGLVTIITWTEWALAMVDLGAGRFDAALERLEAASAGPARYHLNATYFAADQVEAAVRLGQPERAAEPLARFAAWADAAAMPWADAVAHRCRALVEPDAERHYTEAIRLHAGSGRLFERARTELLYGEWLRRARRGADSRAPLRDALNRFTHIGAARWADRARAELRAAGEAPAATETADLIGVLTPQELQVVRLAAVGATNRDIAAQLFLSPRTISHHLYRAFPKLGVTTRTALARLDLD
ncbi:MAG TPA: LuxR C-terminal-related transcriptional regulator [Pseudonocardiaceae bacterium]|nr:LuxR C-terminal-related transcriptional regulator [Pseudonocardiaceae bacterium]